MAPSIWNLKRVQVRVREWFRGGYRPPSQPASEAEICEPLDMTQLTTTFSTRPQTADSCVGIRDDMSTPQGDMSHKPSLNPGTAAIDMAARRPSTNGTQTSSTGPEATTNGLSKSPKRPQMPVGPKTAENIAEAGAGVKLTAAELKKRKAEEKKARRAEKVLEKTQTQPEAPQPSTAPTKSQTQIIQSQAKEDSHHERRLSNKPLPTRPKDTPAPPVEKPQPAAETKKVPMFAHLYPRERRASLTTASREIHPAVLTLGLQLRDYIICGSNARCVAMLLVFTKVIRSYTVPNGTTISRHLITHLGHQISYLSHARPLSISQGNAIRWLKRLISTIDPGLAENEAKEFIIQSIEAFIREKIILADEVISSQGAERIEDGDVVCTFGKSSVVEKTLIKAWKEGGKRFSVIVVDSRPMFEGRNLARALVRAGLNQVEYCLISGLADVVGDVTKCFLGASAMLGNGRLSSRVGTAMVALMVKECAPKASVVVLCESVKFTSRVALDSIVLNELGEPDALVEVERDDVVVPSVPPAKEQQKGGGKKGNDDDGDGGDTQRKGLEGWRDQQNLHVLNLMYDVTPAEHIDMVISELGSLPPTAVPVVNGPGGDD